MWEEIEASGGDLHWLPYANGRVMYSVLSKLKPGRGLPEDISPEIKDLDNDGYHFRHSWLTLEELLNIDWLTPTGRTTVCVNIKNYELFKNTGKVDDYCTGAFGSGVKKEDNQTMDSLLHAANIQTCDIHFYTDIDFNETLGDLCRNFLYIHLPLLQEVGAPEDVRIVFWFDN